MRSSFNWTMSFSVPAICTEGSTRWLAVEQVGHWVTRAFNVTHLFPGHSQFIPCLVELNLFAEMAQTTCRTPASKRISRKFEANLSMKNSMQIAKTCTVTKPFWTSFRSADWPVADNFVHVDRFLAWKETKLILTKTWQWHSKLNFYLHIPIPHMFLPQSQVFFFQSLKLLLQNGNVCVHFVQLLLHSLQICSVGLSGWVDCIWNDKHEIVKPIFETENRTAQNFSAMRWPYICFCRFSPWISFLISSGRHFTLYLSLLASMVSISNSSRTRALSLSWKMTTQKFAFSKCCPMPLSGSQWFLGLLRVGWGRPMWVMAMISEVLVRAPRTWNNGTVCRLDETQLKSNIPIRVLLLWLYRCFSDLSAEIHLCVQLSFELLQRNFIVHLYYRSTISQIT